MIALPYKLKQTLDANMHWNSVAVHACEKIGCFLLLFFFCAFVCSARHIARAN